MNKKDLEDYYGNWKSSLKEKEIIKLEKELNIAIRKYKYWLNKYCKASYIYEYEVRQYCEYKYNQYECIIERNCYLLDKNPDDLI